MAVKVLILNCELTELELCGMYLVVASTIILEALAQQFGVMRCPAVYLLLGCFAASE